jgi:hypothetical protein
MNDSKISRWEIVLRARGARRSKPVRSRKRRTIFATALVCVPLVLVDFFGATTTLSLESVEVKVVVGKGA